MKKLIVLAFASVASVAVFADGGKAPAKAPSPEAFKKLIYQKTGGMLKSPGEQKGRIVVVNAAKDTPSAVVGKHVESFAKQHKVAVEVVSGSFDLKKPAVQGEATLFIADDAELPMSLVAPEARWAMMNIFKLRHEKVQFFEARVGKELTRALYYLCGAANSQYPNALTGCVTKPEELDTFLDARVPVDVQHRVVPYLSGYGITPYRLVPYRKACMEGWAPQPTNDVQKAIWDETFTMPDKPIRIQKKKADR